MTDEKFVCKSVDNYRRKNLSINLSVIIKEKICRKLLTEKSVDNYLKIRQ